MTAETRRARLAPLPAHSVAHGELAIGGIALSRLARQVGRTPFYAYDRGRIDERVAALRAALPAEVSLHYAVKANPMAALVQHLARRVDGLDVASAGELRTALDTPVPPAEISFAGPGKTRAELAQAIAAGVLINLESEAEMRCAQSVAAELDLPARVAVRVNPDFELKSAGMRMGGGPKAFGVDAERVPAMLGEIGRLGLDFQGFHIFSGSQNLQAEAVAEAQTKSIALARTLAAHAPAPVRVLNIGGGFGIPYFAGDAPLDLGRVGAHLHGLMAKAEAALPEARIVIELGRYLVGEAGVYVCRIVDRKVSRGETFLVTDGGLHHHLAASGNFGQVVRKNYPIAIGTRMNGTPTETVNVVGPLCTPLDILGRQVELPRADVGDLVVVFASGAYGLSASPTAFLGHPPPTEALV